MSRFCLIIGLAVFGCMAQAQSAPTTDDLRALRFYIEQDDTASIDAEIRRLQGVYPGWTPPPRLADLLQTQPGPELDNIYARIARNDIAGAKRLLAETRAAFPSWTPPDNIEALINLAEGQIEFDQAITRRDIPAAIALAIRTPDLLRCDRINNTWRLAELQTAAGNSAAARAAYTQIVGTCTLPANLVATIEKADPLLEQEELTALIATAKRRVPAADTELTALQTRLLAGRGVAAPSAAPQTRRTATPAAPAAPAASPTRRTATQAPQMARQVSASSLSSLRLNGDGRIGSVRAAAGAENFRECAARSVRPRSLDIAYERAWCVYNLDRTLESLALFTAASSIGGTVGRDARYGMALSFLGRQMTDSASQLAATTDFTPEQRRTVELIILDQRGVRAYEQKDYARAILFFDELESLEGGLRRDLAILRAYAYLNSRNSGKARSEFRRLDRELSTEETRTGIAAAQ